MRFPFASFLPALLLAAMSLPSPVRAAGLRVIASDSRGVTLQISAGSWALSPPDVAGRVVVTGVPGAHSLGDPGHAQLPAWAAMLALPQGSHPTARILTAAPGVTRDGVRLRIAKRPSFVPDGHGDFEPSADDVTPLTDGVWPAQAVQLGTPGAFRGRTLVGIEVRPFQYDESAARLVVTPTLVVRVDFNRPPGAAALPVTASAPDRFMDDALGSSVLNFDQARAWRAAPAADPAAASLFSAARTARPSAAQAALAFDETQPEVRVKLDSTGVYLLPWDMLNARGYPVGTPIAQVSVHRHEFLEGAAVPYATIELPCEVDDINGNNVFDSGDRIIVYARTWAERSGVSAMQRRWGDAEKIFVTVKPTGGLRVPQRPAWRGQTGLTPLASYPLKQHWEVNDLEPLGFLSLPSDTALDWFNWTANTSYSDRPDTITFGVNDIDTTHAADFKIGWMGRGPEGHYIWAAVKNPVTNAITTVADGVFWVGTREQITDQVLFASAFSEGTTRFLDWGKTDSGTPAPGAYVNAALNWFETTYWRRFNAVHERLIFNTADAAGELQIHAAGFFSDSIRVWDVTNPDAPVRVVADPAHLTASGFDLQDSVAAGQPHAYIAMGLQDPPDPDLGPMQLPASAYEPVTRRPIYSNTSGDYLLVVPEAFLSAVTPLADLRRSQGMSVVVATTEQLFDEFNGGRRSYAAIQRFVRFAYANWSSRFLLLVGDGTLDPLNHGQRSGQDFVPVYPVPGPVSVASGFETTVSDNAYGCITGNCNPISGAGDVIPEIMVGRLPANSLTDVQNMVAKIVNYEDLSGDQSWRLHCVLISDDSYSDAALGVSGGPPTYCWKDYEEYFVGLNRKAQSVIQQEAGLTQMNVELFNERYYVTNPAYYIANGPGDTCRVSRLTVSTYVNRSVTPILFSRINTGTMWVNYQGHANEYVLTHENLYQNSGDSPGSDNKALFANDGKPVLWTAFSCHSNMFARPEGQPSQFSLGGCIGEDIVTLPRGGAIAAWASSCYEVVPRDDSTHLNTALARALFSDPPNDPLVPGGSRVVLGEAIQAAFVRFMPQVSGYSWERGTPITYVLLGDPAQRISVGQPQLVVHANDTLVVDGRPVRLHSPADTLRLVADLVSTVQLDSIGLFINEGAGDVPVQLYPGDIVPAFPDTGAGSVFGGRRFQLTYRTRLKAETYHYRILTRDLNGLQKSFIVQFNYDATLRVSGNPIHDGDGVSPNAALSLMLVSPAPIDPATQITLTINGANVIFSATPAPGDASGREWILSWTHADYPTDNYQAIIALAGGPTLTRTFRVNSGALKIQELLAFPNPFDNDGTRFSFMLQGSAPADVRISIMTMSGRRIWSGDFRGFAPGYHQVPWDGRDAEGSPLANGTYFYRISAVTAAGEHTNELGRLVKLRKPRHVDVATTP